MNGILICEFMIASYTFLSQFDSILKMRSFTYKIRKNAIFSLNFQSCCFHFVLMKMNFHVRWIEEYFFYKEEKNAEFQFHYRWNAFYAWITNIHAEAILFSIHFAEACLSAFIWYNSMLIRYCVCSQAFRQHINPSLAFISLQQIQFKKQITM